jgi:hypothetical protein
MNRIDELPLDIFSDDDATAAQPAQDPTVSSLPGASVADDPVSAADADGLPTARRKLYDALIVCGLIVSIGLVFQILWFDILTPLINVGAGIVFFQMTPEQWRQRQRWRLDGLVRRFDADVERLRAHGLDVSRQELRLLYDVGLVMLAAITLRVCLLAAGFGWVLPGRAGWWLAILIAGAAYVRLIGPRRADVHLWIDAHVLQHHHESLPR